jgi:hypothetical protein
MAARRKPFDDRPRGETPAPNPSGQPDPLPASTAGRAAAPQKRPRKRRPRFVL